jgi:hypothetical protein
MVFCWIPLKMGLLALKGALTMGTASFLVFYAKKIECTVPKGWLCHVLKRPNKYNLPKINRTLVNGEIFEYL